MLWLASESSRFLAIMTPNQFDIQTSEYVVVFNKHIGSVTIYDDWALEPPILFIAFSMFDEKI